MLLQQREKFRRYLRVLEGQEQAILAEDVERLEAHVSLESEVVGEIRALRRATDPLDILVAGLAAPSSAGGLAVPELKRSLDRLGEEAAACSRRNCRLLEERMETLRTRLRGLPHPRPAASRCARADPLLVDISL